MSTISPATRALAEDLNMNLPQLPGVEHVVTPRYAAIIGQGSDPHFNVVQRLRLDGADIEATVAEVRALFAARGRHRFTWEVGSSATPSDLAARFVAVGIVPDEPEPLAVGMVLAQPLESAPTGLVVRQATSLDDFRAATSVFRACFGGEDAQEDLDAIAQDLARYQADPRWARYVAFLDGEPVAAGDAVFLEAGVVLNGGATLPKARGKGAYRALLAARAEEGARRGACALVTQAGAMSRPILKRLGFVEVAEVRIFLDESGAGRTA